MNYTTILNKLEELKLKGAKQAYTHQMEDTAFHSLSFEDRLYNLLDAQEIFANNKRIETNLRLSKIKNKQALLEDLDYNPKRQINKSQILSLANMDFIRKHQNIIITGKTGCGKSYLAQSLAIKAIHEGFTAYYIRTATLLEDIKLSRIDGSFINLLRKFARYKLLILDDFGVSAISADDAANLFEVIETRSQLSSTIITSQLPVKDWYGFLQNNTIADAILDRIVNSSHRIILEGESLRPKYDSVNKTY